MKAFGYIESVVKSVFCRIRPFLLDTRATCFELQSYIGTMRHIDRSSKIRSLFVAYVWLFSTLTPTDKSDNDMILMWRIFNFTFNLDIIKWKWKEKENYWKK